MTSSGATGGMTARRSLAWLLSGNVAFFLLQFGTSIILARLLTPAEMGIYAVATAVVWLMNALQNLGLAGYVTREKDFDASKRGTIAAVALLQASAFLLVLLAIAPVAAWFVGDSRVRIALQLLAPMAFLTPIYSVLLGLWQRDMRFDLVTKTQLFSAVVSASVTLGLAAAGLSYASMSLGSSVAMTITTAITAVRLRRAIRIRPTLAKWREVLGFGWHILLSTSVTNLALRLPTMILGRFLGLAATGLYTRGAGLIDVLSGTIMTAFQRVIQTSLVQHRDHSGSIAGIYSRSTRLVTGLLWPCFAGLALLAAPTISLLYGDKWVPAAPVLSVLAVAAIIDTAVFARPQVMIAANREGRMPRLDLISCVLGLAAFAFAAKFGLVAAAIGRLLGSAITAAIYVPEIVSATRVRFVDLLSGWMNAALVTIAACIGPVLILSYLGWPLHLAWFEFATIVAIGMLSWLAALYVTGHELWREMLRFVPTMMPGRLRLR